MGYFRRLLYDELGVLLGSANDANIVCKGHRAFAGRSSDYLTTITLSKMVRFGGRGRNLQCLAFVWHELREGTCDVCTRHIAVQTELGFGLIVLK
ncbi:MAG: hypothetical protein ACI82I_000959 [Gammaproteobacteria bacterium]|jgi:hypothetical protein